MNSDWMAAIIIRSSSDIPIVIGANYLMFVTCRASRCTLIIDKMTIYTSMTVLENKGVTHPPCIATAQWDVYKATTDHSGEFITL